MNVNDIVTVATDAIPVDNLNAVELAHISGILAMAVRLAVAEVETLNPPLTERISRLNDTLVEADAKIAVLRNERQDLTIQRNLAWKNLAELTKERDSLIEQVSALNFENSVHGKPVRLRQELEAMTAARDAAVARSEALAKELGELRTYQVMYQTLREDFEEVKAERDALQSKVHGVTVTGAT